MFWSEESKGRLCNRRMLRKKKKRGGNCTDTSPATPIFFFLQAKGEFQWVKGRRDGGDDDFLRVRQRQIRMMTLIRMST